MFSNLRNSIVDNLRFLFDKFHLSVNHGLSKTMNALDRTKQNEFRVKYLILLILSLGFNILMTLILFIADCILYTYDLIYAFVKGYEHDKEYCVYRKKRKQSCYKRVN